MTNETCAKSGGSEMNFRVANEYVAPSDIAAVAPQARGVENESKRPEADSRSDADALPSEGATEALAATMLGFSDPDLLNKIAADLLSLASSSDGMEKNILEAGVLIVRGVAPTTMVEGLLAVQMAAIHQATIKYARVLERAETAMEIQLAQSGLNKLARTFSMQVDTLQRLRDGGTRTMRIERVTVGDGGQAILGHINQGVAGKK